MRDIRRFLFASIFVALGSASLFAALPTRPRGYVTDEAGILSERVRTGLENVMSELEQKTGAQVAVVTASSLNGRDVAEVAEKLFQEWGVGNKAKDDGVLLLVAPIERKARIEVGYGLEGLIPDARAGRILDEQAMPHFRAGDMEGGVAATAVTIAQVIAADRGVTLTGVGPMPTPRRSSSGLPLFMFVIFIVLALRRPWLLLFLMNSGGRRGGGGWSSGSGGGFGGFGGFGGGSSGGGGASRGW